MMGAMTKVHTVKVPDQLLVELIIAADERAAWWSEQQQEHNRRKQFDIADTCGRHAAQVRLATAEARELLELPPL